MNFQIIPKKGREESEGTKIHGGNMDSLSFGAKKKMKREIVKYSNNTRL